MNILQQHIIKKLEGREKENALRETISLQQGIDFVTNDYLGFARKEIDVPKMKAGSGASRLLGGSTKEIQELEKELAAFYGKESALIFSSGYAANVGLFSCLLGRNDTYIYDEYIHASMRDGIRLSLAKSYSFKHNDTSDLHDKLMRSKGKKIVVTESLFSMDGDFAPLKKMSEVCKTNGAALLVDEAHAAGIFGKQGRGYSNEMNLDGGIDAKIITFGKALGCHGAAILGTKELIHYLVNFSRAFIYTTAPSPVMVWHIAHAHEMIKHANEERKKLQENIDYFLNRAKELKLQNIPAHRSPVQIAVFPGNENARTVALKLREKGFEIRAVLSPTVPQGMERLRICLHAFNTKEEISSLLNELRYYA
ncbi:MAG: aminotransferase class I/II-fold pyridoxal phosphate-dependent enzyme [Flavobacteriales bacterium]